MRNHVHLLNRCTCREDFDFEIRARQVYGKG
jgi:hypothetical protein